MIALQKIVFLQFTIPFYIKI